MLIAEAASHGTGLAEDPLWAHIDAWADELGLTGPTALARARARRLLTGARCPRGAIINRRFAGPGPRRRHAAACTTSTRSREFCTGPRRGRGRDGASHLSQSQSCHGYEPGRPGGDPGRRPGISPPFRPPHVPVHRDLSLSPSASPARSSAIRDARHPGSRRRFPAVGAVPYYQGSVTRAVHAGAPLCVAALVDVSYTNGFGDRSPCRPQPGERSAVNSAAGSGSITQFRCLTGGRAVIRVAAHIGRLSDRQQNLDISFVQN